MGSILDLITHANTVSLGELHARSDGNVIDTAAELAKLLKAGLVQIDTGSAPPIPAGTDDATQLLTRLLNSDELASDVYISPTALLFKSTTS